MKTNTNISAKRNQGIDILRGFCILAVILLHLNIQVDFKETFLGAILPRPWFNLFFWSGFYGVVIFFTLSGYLIANSTIQKWHVLGHINMRGFYMIRFARIMPLLVVLLLILVSLHLLDIPGFVINEEQTSLGRAVFSVLTFHINWLQIKVGYLPANWDVLWSISIEETFYLFFPILCFFIRKEWQFIAVVSVFLFISPWARVALFPGNELGDRNHLAFIDSIAMGCITAILAHRVRFSKIYQLLFLIIGSICMILVLFFRGWVYRSGLVGMGLNITLLSLGVSLVVLWMHNRHITGKEKDRWIFRGIRKMGRLSYEIYVTHMFIIIGLVGIFKKLGLSGAWTYILYVLVILGSYYFARFLHFRCTEPLNQWLRNRYQKKWKPIDKL